MLALVSACGGGNSVDPTPAGPPPPPPSEPPISTRLPTLRIDTPAPGQLRISWEASERAASYRLFRGDGQSWSTDGTTLPASVLSVTEPISVHRTDWAKGRFLVTACTDPGGCRDFPFDGTPIAPAMIGAIGYVKASNPGFDDSFGARVALSADGRTLAVAAPQESSAATGIGGNQADRSATHAGAVYVFVKTGATWTQQAYVKAANTDAGDLFGTSVALSGDGGTLVVGAVGESSAATGPGGDPSDNTAPVSGAVYVFVRDGTTWTQQAYLKASNAQTGDGFGDAVALSRDGNTLAVGASTEDSAATGVGGDATDESSPNAGAVYVFSRAGGAWTQQAYVKASNTDTAARFGATLAMSADGSTLAVGALGESSAATGIGGDPSDRSAPGAGAVYTFGRSGTTWVQQAYVKGSGTRTNGMFGRSVALSADGGYLAVGAIGEMRAGGQPGGVAYVFVRSGAAWSQQVRLDGRGTGAFGMAVALTDDAGEVYVGNGTDASAATGVGGDPDNTRAPLSGAVHVSRRTGGTLWDYTPLGPLVPFYVKASNTGAGDLFGAALAISGDGATLAVGAPREAGAAAGIGGNQADDSMPGAGAVYLY